MIWILLIFTGFAFGEDRDPICLEKNQKIAMASQAWNNSQWLGLLHMREGWFKPKSKVDGDFFFISPRGSKSPKDEMLATIDAFCANSERKTESTNIPKLPARCLYPAREQHLEAAGLSGWPKPECSDLDKWKAKVGNQAVHLVFSSYYANNPSSVFGHSLLRFDRVQASSGQMMNPLLSYGVNYAAESTTSNGALYALLGMTGGFKGRFASLPYYYKVREYSDFDSRDLWEYELNLTPAQINMLLNHIWELGFTYFNYYYFTENCSYHLLTAIDVVLPKAKLTEKIPWWVIPIDSIKAITRTPGLVKNIRFRPSLYNQLQARLERLDEAGLKPTFFKFVEKSAPLPATLSPENKALVMDAVLDYWDFNHINALMEPTSEPSQKKARLLKERSVLPITAPLVFDLAKQERPDESHESARAGLTLGRQSDRGENIGFDVRFALHDFLDPQKGYPRNAVIDFFRLKGKYFTDDSKFKLTEFKFFEIQLLSPWSKLSKAYSWQALVGFDRSYMGCNYCLVGRTLLQSGMAAGFLKDRVVSYLMMGGDLRISAEQDSFAQAHPAATAGIKVTLPADFHALVQTDYTVGSLYAVSNSLRARGEFRKNLSGNTSVGLMHSKDWQEHVSFENTELGFYYFF